MTRSRRRACRGEPCVHPTPAARATRANTRFAPTKIGPRRGEPCVRPMRPVKATDQGDKMHTFKRQDQEQMEKAKDLLEGSSTEHGFVKSLFFGRLKLSEVMPYPQPDPAQTAQVDSLLAKLNPFLLENVDPDRIDAEERIPQNVI